MVWQPQRKLLITLPLSQGYARIGAWATRPRFHHEWLRPLPHLWAGRPHSMDQYHWASGHVHAQLPEFKSTKKPAAEAAGFRKAIVLGY
jgi:hypothetical protein